MSSYRSIAHSLKFSLLCIPMLSLGHCGINTTTTAAIAADDVKATNANKQPKKDTKKMHKTIKKAHNIIFLLFIIRSFIFVCFELKMREYSLGCSGSGNCIDSGGGSCSCSCTTTSLRPFRLE